MTAVDLSGVKNYIQQLIGQQMKHQAAVQESFQVAQLCVMITTNRDKMLGTMLGTMGSETAADIVDEADAILLNFLQGLRVKTDVNDGAPDANVE